MTVRLLLAAVWIIVFPGLCFAVNFYDGARAQGWYAIAYSSVYHADRTADSRGRTAKDRYGYRKMEQILRLSYYRAGWVVSGYLPVGTVRCDWYRESVGGIGDINLGAGYFLPVKSIDIVPMLFVELPTGAYRTGKSVNYGSHQYDIKPLVFIYKQMGRMSMDGAVKYFLRCEEPDTGIAAGNEVHLQGLLGWNFNRSCKAGPSVSWMRSSAQRLYGSRVSGSSRETLSAGADVYVRLPFAGVTFTYLHDVRSKNTTLGDFFQVKAVRKF